MLIDLYLSKFLASNSEIDEELVRDAYTKTLDLKIATPTMIINYTEFLQTKCRMFEESFRVFERGIEMFPWPHKNLIW